MWMEMAKVVARRGTCPRLCVGAVAVRGRQFSVGYNGAPSHTPHCVDVGCILHPETQACLRALHAEANALAHLPAPSSDTDGGELILYVTHSPCMNCALAIVDAGVDAVYFESTYRDTAPIIYLLDHDIRVYRLMANGYIVEGNNGDLVEANQRS